MDLLLQTVNKVLADVEQLVWRELLHTVKYSDVNGRDQEDRLIVFLSFWNYMEVSNISKNSVT